MTTRTTISTTTLLRCVCQRQPRSALQFRQASSSSLSSSSTAKKPGLYTRIKEAAEAATYKFRPLSPRAELAVQRQQEKQDGLGSLLQKTLEEAQEAVAVNEEPQLPTSGYVRSGKVYTQVSRYYPFTLKSSLISQSQHKTSTGTIPISPRKLNAVGRLIAGKPIDSAILQMQMSDKRVAHTRIKSMLVLARDHAVMKGLRRERLVVQEAWVSKGVYLRRIEPRGRGKFGIRMKPEWVVCTLPDELN
ncbi:hypothetical protein EMMF5_002026 [Cystobasidiomycetes sp. EMM_F5]